MGMLLSRQRGGVEELDIPSNSAYKYPPKTGNYFASHFYMGGEKFESGTPESYLFGENADLNFLGSRPVPFPYPAPPPSEPVRALRSLVNIRKDSLRLVRCSEEVKPDDGEGRSTRVRYNVEFTFDSDARVQLCIFYQATEGMHAGAMRYIPKTPSLKSEFVSFPRGAGQQFCLPSHSLDLSDWSIQEMTYDPEKEMYPMVIQASVAEGGEHVGHSHILIATFDKAADGTFSVKPLKQKQVVDGVSYLLQEIYGIENKNSLEPKSTEEDGGDNSGECVVCLSDVRDTIILPCRHLCLCNACADTLRYQANNCPICRLPFRALLQIRAVRRKVAAGPSPAPLLAAHTSDTEESSEPLPPGYEAVSLLEALNGLPPFVASAPPLAQGEEPPPARQPPLPCHRGDGPHPHAVATALRSVAMTTATTATTATAGPPLGADDFTVEPDVKTNGGKSHTSSVLDGAVLNRMGSRSRGKKPSASSDDDSHPQISVLSVAGELLALPMPCGVENSAYSATSSSASSTVSSPEVEPMSSSSSGAGGGGAGGGSSGARSSMSVASSTSGASHEADGAGDVNGESPTGGEPTAEGLGVGSFLPGSLGTRDLEGNVVEVDSSGEVLLEAGGGSAALYEVDNESPALRAELVDNVACLPGSLLCPEAMEGTVAVAMVAVAGVPTTGPSACGDGESGQLLTGPMAV
uniref:E3 ubiquitin-protein ligase n=1 Tax=Petromyzon marinus TaxID=7757 RepID=A0AAJ7U8Z2_PETMA|nr:probable E3 ubiquitin-protein ligase MGRN1 isoform X2 [Petromyzon marinus]